METTESSSRARTQERLNAVRQYVVYGATDMPSVEVLVVTRSDGIDAIWAPGELRMHTQHEDGSRTFTAQFRLDDRLMIDNFSEDRVRRNPTQQTAGAAR